MGGKVYIGDSVYARFDGATLVLTTENGADGASNTIYLEDFVWERLVEFVDSGEGGE